MKTKEIYPVETVINKILLVRGQKAILDSVLAELYGVETKKLNEQVKRNIRRFPKDFMFRLTVKEWKNMMSQIVISSDLNNKQKNSSQFVMSSIKHRGANYLPYAFTERGV